MAELVEQHEPGAPDAIARVAETLRSGSASNTVADPSPVRSTRWNSGHGVRGLSSPASGVSAIGMRVALSPSTTATLARVQAARAILGAVLAELGVPPQRIAHVVDVLQTAVAEETAADPDASMLVRFEGLARAAHRAVMGGAR